MNTTGLDVTIPTRTRLSPVTRNSRVTTSLPSMLRVSRHTPPRPRGTILGRNLQRLVRLTVMKTRKLINRIPMGISLTRITFRMMSTIMKRLNLNTILPSNRNLKDPIVLLIRGNVRATKRLTIRITLRSVTRHVRNMTLQNGFRVNQRVRRASLQTTLTRLLSR